MSACQISMAWKRPAASPDAPPRAACPGAGRESSPTRSGDAMLRGWTTISPSRWNIGRRSQSSRPRDRGTPSGKTWWGGFARRRCSGERFRRGRVPRNAGVVFARESLEISNFHLHAMPGAADTALWTGGAGRYHWPGGRHTQRGRQHRRDGIRSRNTTTIVLR